MLPEARRSTLLFVCLSSAPIFARVHEGHARLRFFASFHNCRIWHTGLAREIQSFTKDE